MKTIKEKLKFYLDLPIDEEHHIGFKLGFMKGFEFAQRWIPVKEELPEQVCESGDSNQVLIKTEHGYISTGIYDHSVNKWINDIPNRYFMSVTHWRPIERQ